MNENKLEHEYLDEKKEQYYRKKVSEIVGKYRRLTKKEVPRYIRELIETVVRSDWEAQSGVDRSRILYRRHILEKNEPNDALVDRCVDKDAEDYIDFVVAYEISKEEKDVVVSGFVDKDNRYRRLFKIYEEFDRIDSAFSALRDAAILKNEPRNEREITFPIKSLAGWADIHPNRLASLKEIGLFYSEGPEVRRRYGITDEGKTFLGKLERKNNVQKDLINELYR